LIAHVLRLLFSARSRTALPVLMDGLAVSAVALTTTGICMLLGSNEFGITDSFTSWQVLLANVVATVGVTALISTITIFRIRRRGTFTQRCSPMAVIVAGLAAILGPVMLHTLLHMSFDPATILRALAFGPYVAPAAIRLTVPIYAPIEMGVGTEGTFKPLRDYRRDTQQ